MLTNVKFELLFKVNSFYLLFFYGTKISSNPLCGKKKYQCFSAITVSADQQLCWWATVVIVVARSNYLPEFKM